VPRDARTRIVFNALPLRPQTGGVGTYIRELLRELPSATSATLVAAVEAGAVGEVPPGVTPAPQPERSGIRRAVAGARGFGPCDLVHGLDVDLPLLRRTSQGPSVATVHDLSIFDVAWAFPRHRVIGERAIVRASLRRADTVIAVSDFTAERLHALIGRDAVVVREAPGSDMAPSSAAAVEAVRTKYQLPERFVLHVGNIEPRKDIDTLVRACQGADVPLLLTGRPLWGTPTPPQGAAALGYVPAEDLPALYGAATLVGYASVYEGFGLPPVEAMACGAAVVTTRVPAVVEVVGDAAATFRPGDVNGLTRLVRELLADDDRRAQLARDGRRAVRTLSWARAAHETVSVYRSLGVG
jgi:glycosyltransferase involved in cell wall biosynthesis